MHFMLQVHATLFGLPTRIGNVKDDWSCGDGRLASPLIQIYTTRLDAPSPVYVAFYGVCRGHVNVSTAATVVAFEPPPTERDYLFLLSVLTAISIRPSLASLSGKPLMAWIAWLA